MLKKSCPKQTLKTLNNAGEGVGTHGNVQEASTPIGTLKDTTKLDLDLVTVKNIKFHQIRDSHLKY